jgi:hypothetical protein
MITVGSIVGGVLDYCRHPSEKALPRGLIAERFMDRWAYYVNQMTMTGEAWYLEKTTISINENQSEYPINAASFGKPVVAYILDDSLAIAGELEIVRFRDQVEGVFTNVPPGYSLPASVVPATRNGISFFTESGQQKLRMVGTPTNSGTLVLHYVPSGNTFASLTDGITLLDNFANLFKIHTAIMCMPDCEWTGYSAAESKEKRQEIKETLVLEFGLLTTQFNEYKNTIFQEQTDSREGFGDSQEYGYYDLV